MTGRDENPDVEKEAARRRKNLPAAARRALDEAAERRAQSDAGAKNWVKEIAGRDGPEPTRFGDWEKNGIASDF